MISFGPDSLVHLKISTNSRRFVRLLILYTFIWSIPLSTAQRYLLSGVGRTQLTWGRKFLSPTLPRPLWNTPSTTLPRRPSLWVCTTVTFPSWYPATKRYLPSSSVDRWQPLIPSISTLLIKVRSPSGSIANTATPSSAIE